MSWLAPTSPDLSCCGATGDRSIGESGSQEGSEVKGHELEELCVYLGVRHPPIVMWRQRGDELASPVIC